MLYPCLGVDDAIFYIYQKVGVGEQGMTDSGFEIWIVWCIFDHKYKNKSTIAA